MAASSYFCESRVARNILTALAFTNLNKLTKLMKDGHFRDTTMHCTSLQYSSLDEYIEVSGYSLRYFLFGDENLPKSYYTKIDSYVIEILNQLSDAQLTNLKQTISLFFHTPLMDVPTDATPSVRFFQILNTRRNSGLPSAIPPEEQYKYREDVMVEINRFKASKYTNLFSFHPDYWMDLSTVVGVSVRWILGVKKAPLFCNRALADDVFELFTLLPPMMKYTFTALLIQISPVKLPELEKTFFEGGSVV